MKLLRTNKSQALTTDLILAISLFTLILLAIFTTSEILTQRIHESQARYDIEMVARNSLEILLNSPGLPSNWHNTSLEFNPQNIHSIGLSDGRNSLINSQKLNHLINTFDSNSANYLTLIGLLGTNYSITLNITQYDNNYNKLSENIIGKIPSKLNQKLVIERLALDDRDRYIRIRAGVWT